MKAQDALSERRRQEVREYFEQTLHSRLDDKRTGRIIAVQQRLHEADFAAYLIEKASYRHLNLPAIAESEQQLPLYMGRCYIRAIGDLLRPEMESQDALEQIRRDVGAYAFSAQYQQNPTPADSEHLRLDRMTLIDHPPERDEMLMVVQTWDTAIKDSPDCDFSVCTTWGWRDRWHLLDVHRARHDFPGLKSAAATLRRQWRADYVLVEDSSNGTALVQQLRIEGDTRFHLKRVKASKLERFIAQTDMLQSNRVALPTKAPWFALLKHELFVFPHGRYDDQVDSVTMFLDWAQRRGRAVLSQWDPQVSRRPAPRPRPPGRRARS